MPAEFEPLFGCANDFTDRGKRGGGGANQTVMYGPPHCVIVDDEPGVCHFISMVLREFGLSSSSFASVSPALEDAVKKNPRLIFLDVSLEGSDAIDAIRDLGKLGYSGHVQLISGKNEILLKDINRIGQQHSLSMLPALAKPFDAQTVRNLILQLNWDTRGNLGATQLKDALRKGWIEFWYQPKIDLKSNSLAGVEALARLNHPMFGYLPPSAFLPGADKQSLLELAEHALQAVSRDGLELSASSPDLQFSVNIEAEVLASRTFAELARESRRGRDAWPSLILELTETQIIEDLEIAFEAATQLKIYGIKLSIDDFGTGYSSLGRLKQLPFAELKIDRSFVHKCSVDPASFAICQSAIELARRFDCLVCAEGIEDAADLKLLNQMGCDFGQGFLLARPMPKQQLLSALQERPAMKAPGAAFISTKETPREPYPNAPSGVVAPLLSRGERRLDTKA